jgi:predicted nicotinamide N-methyase
MGARVMLTDYKEKILSLLRENIAANDLDGRAKAALLDWTKNKNHVQQQKRQKYDYIILADVLYYDTGEAPGLVPTLVACATQGTEIFLAYEDRKNKASLKFFDRARVHFELEQLAIPAVVVTSAKLPDCIAHSTEINPVRLYKMVLRPQVPTRPA